MRTAEDLASEAAECIDNCSLHGDELRLYLADFISSCALDGDLEAMKRGADLARRRYEKKLDTP